MIGLLISLAVISTLVGVVYFSDATDSPNVVGEILQEAQPAARESAQSAVEAAKDAARALEAASRGESRPVAPATPELGPLTPITIGATAVKASIARTPKERTAGLSGVLELPEDVVKLFVFDVLGPQSIWMKEMLFALDIMWLDKSGVVVHVETNVAPETFPTSFSSPVPALYVIEAQAGFVETHGIKLGAVADLAKVVESNL